MKLELENGVWLADGKGDCPTTKVEKNAREFDCIKSVLRALEKARKFIGLRNPKGAKIFKNASIQEDMF